MASASNLDIALITAGAALAGVVIGQFGTYVIERLRERRAARNARDQAIAELLTAVVDLVTSVQTVRAAYQGQGRWREYTRRAAVILAAVGSEFGSPKGLTVDQVLDWGRLAPVFDRLLGEIRDMDDRQRLVALDLATLLLPRTQRFYSAVAALTLGKDKKIADAVRRLAPDIAGLLEVIAGRQRTYERARRRAEHALGEFRAAVDRRGR